MTFTWLFECTPALSNFVYNVPADSCINHDIMRFSKRPVSIDNEIKLIAAL